MSARVRSDDVLLEFLREVEDVVVDAETVRHTTGVVDVGD